MGDIMIILLKHSMIMAFLFCQICNLFGAIPYDLATFSDDRSPFYKELIQSLCDNEIESNDCVELLSTFYKSDPSNSPDVIVILGYLLKEGLLPKLSLHETLNLYYLDRYIDGDIATGHYIMEILPNLDLPKSIKSEKLWRIIKNTKGHDFQAALALTEMQGSLPSNMNIALIEPFVDDDAVLDLLSILEENSHN
jgi:hypothetical protein